MARIVKFDEHRRRRIRRRRWLRDIDCRLRRLEGSVVVLQAEEVAGELITVGKNLVRVLQEFEAEWHERLGGPAAAAAAGGAPPAEAQAREAPSAPYAAVPAGHPSDPPAHPGSQAGALTEKPQPRAMDYPEYWKMVGTALNELAGHLEHLSARAVQHSLQLGRSKRYPRHAGAPSRPAQPPQPEQAGDGP